MPTWFEIPGQEAAADSDRQRQVVDAGVEAKAA
jgi:hypothetical protein